jgi:zinc transporter ZupT
MLRHRVLQEDSHEGHSEVSWKFGVSVLGGFLLPFAMSAIFPQRHRHDLDEIEHHTAEAEALQALDHSSDGSSPPDVKVPDGTANVDDDDLTPNQGEISTKGETKESTTAGGEVVSAVAVTTNGPSAPAPAAIPREIKKPVDWGLCGAILLGDAFHNFADGIFLGSAFLTCGSAVAISVLVSTLYHEIVQELADFLVLTKHAGLSIPLALLFNFLSGFSVMLGGIVVFAVQLSDLGIGALLSISAGVYIHIAAVECMPRVVDAMKSRLDYLFAFGMFAAGAIPIGLVLLAHQHCEA